jgi:hypothetical protein
LTLTASVGMGLLLYRGNGMLPALAGILTVLFLFLAMGLSSACPPPSETVPDRGDQRPWTQALVVQFLAAGYAAAWEAFRGFGATGWTQMVGLTLWCALPALAAGRVLGGWAENLIPRRGSAGTGVAAMALIGAAVGGWVLVLIFPGFSPTSILMVAMVALSAGALLEWNAPPSSKGESERSETC